MLCVLCESTQPGLIPLLKMLTFFDRLNLANCARLRSIDHAIAGNSQRFNDEYETAKMWVLISHHRAYGEPLTR